MAVRSADELTPLADQVAEEWRQNFSRFLSPDFLHELRRFLAKSNLVRPYSVSVGTVAVQLVAFNPNRIRVSIFNNGNATIFYGAANKVAVGSAGSPNAGFPLLQQTGIIIDDNVGEIWAISGSAGMDVRIDDCTLESF